MRLESNPHIETDELSLESLTTRFRKHVAAVESNTLKTNAYVYAVLCARGLHKLITERAIAEDNDDAMNLALGAPHWLTYNDGTLTAMIVKGKKNAE